MSSRASNRFLLRSLPGSRVTLPQSQLLIQVIAPILQGSNGSGTTDQNSNSICCAVKLTNSTTVTAVRGASNSDSMTVTAVVVEFTSAAVNSATQSGTISLNSVSSNTATITSVSANAFVLFLGETCTAASLYFDNASSSVVLTNSTTVTAHRGSSTTSSGTTVYFMVVDLLPSVVAAVAPFSFTFPSSNTTTNTMAITSLASTVTPTNSIIIYNGVTNDSGGGVAQALINAQLFNGLTVEFNASNAYTDTRIVYGTVVTFNPVVLKINVQRGVIKIPAGSTSATATISSVTTSKSFCNPVGVNSNSGGAEAFGSCVLTNSTTVTLSWGGPLGSAVMNGSYEVVEFN